MSTNGTNKRTGRIAIASDDGLTVHRHFGRAERFRIYDIGFDGDGGGYDFVEERTVARLCAEGGHSAAAIEAVADALDDCEIVVAAKVGPGAAEYLMRRGKRVFEGYGMLEDLLREIATNRLSLRPVDAGRALW
jgi:predicted Fe-Mo cluster-binding NifX family protein